MKLWGKADQIKEETKLTFHAHQGGWYLVSISARVKSEKQRGPEITDDEDLRVEINSRKFPQLDNSTRCLDSPTAFSGGKLHNRLKTVHFVIYLSPGERGISLVPDETATVELVEVQPIEDFPRLTLNLEEQAEDGNGRPWVTFVLVNTGLKAFTIKATVNWRFLDGDDIKVIVNGKTKRNWFSIRHHYWVFASGTLRKIFGKETIERTFEENLPPADLHYLEVWADVKPTLHQIGFDFSQSTQTPADKIQKYTDETFGRDYNQLDEHIVDAVTFWNEFFQSQDYPPSELLDPNLVKAIVYRESDLGYYPNEDIIDVMQVWGNDTPETLLGKEGYPANEFISKAKKGHISYSYPKNRIPPKVTTREESIFWGVRWLYHKAQAYSGQGERGLEPPYERWWLSWEDAIRGYNANEQIVEEYLAEVLSIYEKGIDSDGNVLW